MKRNTIVSNTINNSCLINFQKRNHLNQPQMVFYNYELMTFQDYYQKAMKFAGEKHANQKVPGTKANYLLHIANVSMEVIIAHKHHPDFDLNTAIQIAILHDTIEDTATTYDEINSHFGKVVANGVQALTKNESLNTKEERMMDSLQRINLLSKEVGLVKLADRITNLQHPPSHWSTEKIKKYSEEAQLIALTLISKNDYLNTRLTAKIESYNNYW